MRKNSKKLPKLFHYGFTINFVKQKRPECPFNLTICLLTAEVETCSAIIAPQACPATISLAIALAPVAYAGFSKGGGPGNSKNLRIMKTKMKIFPHRIGPFSCQNQVKTKKKKKKRSSLKFNLVFNPKLGECQKKGLRPPFVRSNLLPKSQRGGPCRNFAYYSIQITLSWRPKGGAMATCPTLNTPWLAPQLFLNGCADASAASILAILRAIAQFKYD